jgi:hypothetical protein
MHGVHSPVAVNIRPDVDRCQGRAVVINLPVTLTPGRLYAWPWSTGAPFARRAHFSAWPSFVGVVRSFSVPASGAFGCGGFGLGPAEIGRPTPR